MKEIKSPSIDANIRKILSFATSERNVEKEYESYIQSPLRALYGYHLGNIIVGCIGIEFLGSNRCELKHIAVSPNYRGKGIGSEMISYIQHKYSLSFICAETDNEAVHFYINYGFTITSLGEKYPGVERFKCFLEMI